VTEAVLGLVRGDASLGECLLGLFQHVREVLGVDVIEDVHLADGLLGVVPQDALPGGVGVAQGAVRLHYRDDL